MKLAILLLTAVISLPMTSLAAAPAAQSESSSIATSLVGTWNVLVSVDQENHEARLVFKMDGGVLSGRVQGGNRDIELKSLKTEGDTLTFSVNTGEHSVNFTVKVNGQTMEGTLKVEDQTGRITGKKADS